MQIFSKKMQKNLHISKKSSTFAPAFKKKGPLAQLNRVPHYGCGGCRFESCMDHKRTTERPSFLFDPAKRFHAVSHLP